MGAAAWAQAPADGYKITEPSSSVSSFCSSSHQPARRLIIIIRVAVPRVLLPLLCHCLLFCATLFISIQIKRCH